MWRTCEMVVGDTLSKAALMSRERTWYVLLQEVPMWLMVLMRQYVA